MRKITALILRLGSVTISRGLRPATDSVTLSRVREPVEDHQIVDLVVVLKPVIHELFRSEFMLNSDS